MHRSFSSGQPPSRTLGAERPCFKVAGRCARDSEDGRLGALACAG